jgi:hypothetical protein
MAKTRTLKTQNELSTDAGSLDGLAGAEQQTKQAEKEEVTVVAETGQTVANVDAGQEAETPTVEAQAEPVQETPVTTVTESVAEIDQILAVENEKQQKFNDPNAPAIQQFTQNSLNLNPGGANAMLATLPISSTAQQQTAATNGQPARRGGFVTHGISPTSFK